MKTPWFDLTPPVYSITVQIVPTITKTHNSNFLMIAIRIPLFWKKWAICGGMGVTTQIIVPHIDKFSRFLIERKESIRVSDIYHLDGSVEIQILASRSGTRTQEKRETKNARVVRESRESSISQKRPFYVPSPSLRGGTSKVISRSHSWTSVPACALSQGYACSNSIDFHHQPPYNIEKVRHRSPIA
jgi:hypothetical protein